MRYQALSSQARSPQKWWPEGLVFLLSFLALLFFWRNNLFYGTALFSHDNAYWSYPIFRFVTERILHGENPFWNPYSHGGEPFLPMLLQLRMLSPTILLPMLFGSLFTKSIPLLFHWTRLFEMLFCLSGIYLVLRPIAKQIWTRAILIPILIFSGLMLNPCRQDGILSIFLFVPWIELFSSRIFLEGRSTWRNWITLALCLGLQSFSYFLVGGWLWLFFGGIGLLLFERRALFSVGVKEAPKILLSAFLVLCLMSPNIFMWLDEARFVFPVRMTPHDISQGQTPGAPVPLEAKPSDEVPGLRIDYDLIKETGGHINFVDILQSLAPQGNPNVFGVKSLAWELFGQGPSDSLIFLGLLPWVLALYGLLLRRGPHYKVWAAQLILFTLLSLGPSGGLHQVLFPIFPPLWFIRNMNLMAPFLLFILLYFFVLGFDEILEKGIPKGKTLLVLVSLLTLQMSALIVFSPQRFSLLGDWGLFLAAPLALFFVKRRPVWLFVFILADLLFHFQRAQFVYASLPPIESAFETSRFSSKTSLLSPASVTADYKLGIYEQVPRYLDAVYQRPAVFSPTVHSPALKRVTGESLFDEIRKNYRWNSGHLLRSYFETIHSKQSSKILESQFRVGLSPFAFLSSPESSFQELTLTEENGTLKGVAPGKGLLYWASSFDKAWEARVNGVPVKPLRLYSHFTAIPIEGGSFSVDLRYRPYSLLFLLAAYYGVLLASLVLLKKLHN
jgi:hypothetical protein